MNVFKRVLVVAAWMLSAVPLAAQTNATSEEREENRRRLERLKDQPEVMAKVRKKAIFFASLPEDRRTKLLDLDQQLQKEPLANRKRLEKTLEGYAIWLEGLDSDQRKMIKDAPDSKTRLDIIKKIRTEEWLNKQPKAVQDELAKLGDEKRVKKIGELRDQERKQKNHWSISARFWDDLSKGRTMPARLSDLDGEVASFFAEYLLPRLSSKEKTTLKEAEGQWPLFPMTLVALADRHPPALPDDKWPRHFKELPREVQKRMPKTKGGGFSKRFLGLEGERLARAVSLLSKKGKPLPHELWPQNKTSLSEPVKNFISAKLEPILDRDEKAKLNLAEVQGWPSFPLMLKQLAEDHDLQIPWHSLPGNPELWDKYRLKQRLIR